MSETTSENATKEFLLDDIHRDGTVLHEAHFASSNHIQFAAESMQPFTAFFHSPIPLASTILINPPDAHTITNSSTDIIHDHTCHSLYLLQIRAQSIFLFQVKISLILAILITSLLTHLLQLLFFMNYHQTMLTPLRLFT